ncbi:MAG: response regulator transcription factor [Proteobacteria bacterium]|nr:MAG: response regulator transcription factor [Pseudomonadota bacterium]
MTKILIIEDEESIRRVLRFNLEQKGFVVHEATTGAEGLKLSQEARPQLVILDLGLPDRSGLEVLKELRAWSKIPVLVLTATDDELTKVTLLEAGADDYIAKPFGPLELLARINVALRHHRNDGEDRPVFISDDLEIDLATKTVKVNSEVVRLTATEFSLLSALAKNAGQIVSQETLLREVWGTVGADNPHYLRIYIGQLRKKLEPGVAVPKHIQTEPGVGYKIV